MINPTKLFCKKGISLANLSVTHILFSLRKVSISKISPPILYIGKSKNFIRFFIWNSHLFFYFNTFTIIKALKLITAYYLLITVFFHILIYQFNIFSDHIRVVPKVHTDADHILFPYRRSKAFK